jgi:hypothetical protein
VKTDVNTKTGVVKKGGELRTDDRLWLGVEELRGMMSEYLEENRAVKYDLLVRWVKNS